MNQPSAYVYVVKRVDEKQFKDAWRRCEGKPMDVMAYLKCSRNSVYRWAKKYGLK